MDRETKEIKTPQGHVIVVYSYLTGRDRRQIQSVYLREATDFSQEQLKDEGYKGALIHKAEDTTINLLVVSIDGHKAGDTVDGVSFSPVEFMLNLPASEHKFLMAELNAITADKEFESEKKTN